MSGALALGWAGDPADPADLVSARYGDDAHTVFVRWVTASLPEWHAQAACANDPIEVFFPSGRGSSLRRARAICATCPVRNQCLDEALELDLSGVETPGCWGGTSPRERRQLRRQRAAS